MKKEQQIFQGSWLLTIDCQGPLTNKQLFGHWIMIPMARIKKKFQRSEERSAKIYSGDSVSPLKIIAKWLEINKGQPGRELDT